MLEVENSMDRAAALRRIARSQATIGLLPDALATARLIDSPYYRAHALAHVAIAQARGGLDAHATMAEASQAALMIAESDARQRLIEELKTAFDEEDLDIPATAFDENNSDTPATLAVAAADEAPTRPVRADVEGGVGFHNRVLAVLSFDGRFRHRATALWESGDSIFALAALSWPIGPHGVSIPSDLGDFTGGKGAVVIHMEGSEDEEPAEVDDDAVRLFVAGEDDSTSPLMGEHLYDIVVIDGQALVSRVRVSYDGHGGTRSVSEDIDDARRGELIQIVRPLLALTDSTE